METVSLYKHFTALRKSDLRAVHIAHRAAMLRVKTYADNTTERFQHHNELLKKWQDSSEKDRESFVRKEAFEALAAKFESYKEQTALALTLARGKREGVDMVRSAVAAIAGAIVAGLAVWAATSGLR